MQAVYARQQKKHRPKSEARLDRVKPPAKDRAPIDPGVDAAQRQHDLAVDNKYAMSFESRCFCKGSPEFEQYARLYSGRAA